MSQGILLPAGADAPDQQPAPQNGAAGKPERPSLWLEFHPENQSVEVRVNPEKVKTWDFARALCVMAQQACERMAELQMAQQAREAIQNNALVDQVMRDLPRKRR